LTAKDKINAVEKLIHKTSVNSNPKHKYFEKVVKNHPSFRKFPSYLRRAAIADAIGIVSSFQTRYRDWQSGIRRRRDVEDEYQGEIEMRTLQYYLQQQNFYRLNLYNHQLSR
jgi:hypothetical protein